MDESGQAEVIIFPSHMAAPLDNAEPRKLLQMLQTFSGDIEAMAANYSSNTHEQMHFLYAAETVMKSDPHIYAQWKDAIKQNQVIRLRLLQIGALNTLENFKPDKPGDEIAFSKLVLGDLIAGEIATARKGNDVVVPISNDESDAKDEEDAQAAMNL